MSTLVCDRGECACIHWGIRQSGYMLHFVGVRVGVIVHMLVGVVACLCVCLFVCVRDVCMVGCFRRRLGTIARRRSVRLVMESGTCLRAAASEVGRSSLDVQACDDLWLLLSGKGLVQTLCMFLLVQTSLFARCIFVNKWHAFHDADRLLARPLACPFACLPTRLPARLRACLLFRPPGCLLACWPRPGMRYPCVSPRQPCNRPDVPGSSQGVA